MMCQKAVGDVFNPLILFSLAWSLLLLSLSIYFITQPTARYPSITQHR